MYDVTVRFNGHISTDYVLTILKIVRTINIEHLFGFVITKEDCVMSENEMRMLEMVRENDNPELAVLTAIKVLSAFLEQLEEAQ